jgi:hypothetical protein
MQVKLTKGYTECTLVKKNARTVWVNIGSRIINVKNKKIIDA